MEDDREKIAKVAQDALGNLIYTVIYDVANEIAGSGFDQAKVMECADKVANNYFEGGIKIRKKPPPRAKTTKTPSKPKPIDALTAASKKLTNMGQDLVWIKHPEDDKYSYTQSLKLSTGFPVRENSTHKVVMIVNDTESVPLTLADAKIAMTYGLDVDYGSIEDPVEE